MKKTGEPGIDAGLQRVSLGADHHLLRGALPPTLCFTGTRFRELWDLHPATFGDIKMFGRTTPLPRWQKAYGRDYRFSGQVSVADPVPALVEPIHAWVTRHVDARLNGVLANWYDGTLGHFIGPHRDVVRDLVQDSPIVTVSFGETRVLRFREIGGTGFTDLVAGNGSVIVIPWTVNQAWKHEVPKSRAAVGKRISLTFRAFA